MWFTETCLMWLSQRQCHTRDDLNATTSYASQMTTYNSKHIFKTIARIEVTYWWWGIYLCLCMMGGGSGSLLGSSRGLQLRLLERGRSAFRLALQPSALLQYFSPGTNNSGYRQINDTRLVLEMIIVKFWSTFIYWTWLWERPWLEFQFQNSQTKIKFFVFSRSFSSLRIFKYILTALQTMVPWYS